MKISKTICLICVLLISLKANTIFAAVSITEVMYDAEGSDTSREWIEIFNGTGDAINLTSYKFIENGTAHGISHLDGDALLPNNAYAIIADNAATFSTEYPSVSNVHIYDSAFSLSNSSGESLAMKDDQGIVSSEFTYDTSLGAAGDGNTLQYSSGGWVAANPTPGRENGSSGSNNTTTTQTQSPQSSSTTSSPVLLYKKEPAMTFIFDAPKSVVVGSRFEVKPTLFGYGGERVTGGYFVWNFGDGEIRTSQYSDAVDHVYAFPGKYTITCSYKYAAYLGAKPLAVGRTIVDVVEFPIVLDELYIEPIPAIRISNTKDAEYDISGYIIQSGTAQIIIPEGSYIGPRDSIVIRLPVGMYTKESIALLHSTGYVADTFSKPVDMPATPFRAIEEKTLSDQLVGSAVVAFSNNGLGEDPNLGSEMNLSVEQEIIDIHTGYQKQNYTTYGLLAGVIVVSVGGLYLFRRIIGRNSLEEIDEYTLQDE